MIGMATHDVVSTINTEQKSEGVLSTTLLLDLFLEVNCLSQILSRMFSSWEAKVTMCQSNAVL